MDNPLIELLKSLGMPDAQEIRDGMGPIHKAYDKVLEDRNPLATLTRFSLDEGASKELRPIVDFTLISTDGQGFQPETKLLAICLAGFSQVYSWQTTGRREDSLFQQTGR